MNKHSIVKSQFMRGTGALKAFKYSKESQGKRIKGTIVH